MNKETQASIKEQYKLHDTDTGSTQVQIVALTDRIKELAGHLKVNKKDFSSERGLMRLVNQRRGFLRYLERKNPAQYAQIIKALGLRK